MNSSSDSHPDAAALRSDIDHTRERMDATIDALGERFQPRHLLDEALGYVRQHHSSLTQPLNAMRERLSHQTDAAMHAVVDTVKQNPLPLLLMGAGVAWMVYNQRRSADEARDRRYDAYDDGRGDYPRPFRGTIHYDPDAHTDRPLDYRPPVRDEGQEPGALSSYTGQAKEAMHDAAQNVREKLSHAGDYAREKFDAARERAGEWGDHVRERSGELYSRARDGVSHTVASHPLETGLLCLAAGVLAGLAIPTPAPVSRRLGPAVDRMKDRALSTAQQAIQAGRRATDAAVAAAKAEVKATTEAATERTSPALEDSQSQPRSAGGDATSPPAGAVASGSASL
ncbi:MAG TPA: DUF3618 domain-containing protein [Opitutaceae bacterium]